MPDELLRAALAVPHEVLVFLLCIWVIPFSAFAIQRWFTVLPKKEIQRALAEHERWAGIDPEALRVLLQKVDPDQLEKHFALVRENASGLRESVGKLVALEDAVKQMDRQQDAARERLARVEEGLGYLKEQSGAILKKLDKVAEDVGHIRRANGHG